MSLLDRIVIGFFSAAAALHVYAPLKRAQQEMQLLLRSSRPYLYLFTVLNGSLLFMAVCFDLL